MDKREPQLEVLTDRLSQDEILFFRKLLETKQFGRAMEGELYQGEWSVSRGGPGNSTLFKPLFENEKFDHDAPSILGRWAETGLTVKLLVDVWCTELPDGTGKWDVPEWIREETPAIMGALKNANSARRTGKNRYVAKPYGVMTLD
jgi:hypothetical protein